MKLHMKQIQGLLEALKKPFTVSETVPQNPIEHQVWFQPSTGDLYVYILDTNGPVWVQVS